MNNIILNECDEIEKNCEKRAGRFKVLSIMSNLFIIVAGSVIGLLSIDTDYYRAIVITILGFLIALVKTVVTTFRLDNKAIANMQIAIKIRQFKRSLRRLKTEEQEDALERLEKDFDDLKLSAFLDRVIKVDNIKTTVTPTSIRNVTEGCENGL